jgi:phenylacetate-coenzyme A ligase PaaK-like adenylate-forming protein
MIISQIFDPNIKIGFENLALEVFQHQALNCLVYSSYLNELGIEPKSIIHFRQIPFLPIQFFKTHQIVSSADEIDKIFLSSGTTGNVQSKHYVSDLNVYKLSYIKGFEHFYGDIKDYTILALLPGYMEREGSSLIYMVDDLIKKSKSSDSGFYLNDLENLSNKLIKLNKRNKKVLLIGVSYALLDLVRKFEFDLKNTIIMETGGMKGKRKEMIREELHKRLSMGFGVDKIHSEYGMTELLSQAYSKGNGHFETPPWMRIVVRDPEDPLTLLPPTKTGGLNIVDLANINSCSFIATQDLGKINANGTFELMGRFDNSDIRGCNLMVI